MNQLRPIQRMDPILQETLELCYADPRSCRHITDKAGVSHMTVNNWRVRGGAQLGVLTAVLGALGYGLKIVKIKRK